MARTCGQPSRTDELLNSEVIPSTSHQLTPHRAPEDQRFIGSYSVSSWAKKLGVEYTWWTLAAYEAVIDVKVPRLR